MKRKLMGIILTLAMIFICGISPLSSIAYARSPYNSAFPVRYSTTKGNTVSVSAEGYKAAVVVYGNIYCYNTISLIDGINKSDWGQCEDVALYYADAKDNSKSAVSKFAKEHGGRFTYCYDTGDDLWYYARQLNISNSVTFPVVVVLDENDDVQYISTNYTTEDKVYDAIRKFTTLSCDAVDPTIDISVTGRYNYTYANDVLAQINKERSANGLDALVMYTERLESAMYRAAELSVRYSYNYRPNGRTCSYNKIIGTGYDTAAEFAEYLLDKKDYQVLNSENVGAGIGCFEIINGNNTIRYWVVIFTTYSYGLNPSTKTGVHNATLSIPARLSCLELGMEIKDNTIVITNDSEGAMPLSAFTFTSSNTSVASVNNTGTINTKNFGKTTITAKLKAYPQLSVSAVYSLRSPTQVALNKKVSSNKSSVTLYWNKDTSVSGYKIQQYKNGKWVTIKTVSNRNAIKISKLKSDRTYKYRVCAYVTANGKKIYGKYSNVITIRL